MPGVYLFSDEREAPACYRAKQNWSSFGGNAGMWICFDPIGSRDGWGASISFVVLLYWTSITIDASLTNAAASNVPRNTVTSEISVPASAHHENDECRNVTTDNREGTISVISLLARRSPARRRQFCPSVSMCFTRVTP